MKRILIVRTDRVGDVVMITPVIRELRKKFPDAFIAALTRTNTANILTGNPHLNLIITDDLRKGTFRKVVREIRRHKFTHGLLMMPTERAAYQMFFGGVKKRIGVGKKIYEAITLMKSVSRNKYIPLRHEADYCMDLARKLGVKTDNLTPEIFLSKEEKERGKDILSKHCIDSKKLKIIVHTGSGNSSPNWSESKYQTLINEIVGKYGNKVQIILTAREMSPGFTDNFKSVMNKTIFDLSTSQNTLRDFIEIISLADVLISSSTGPMHLASALGVKTISIFCHRRMSRPAHWGALGSKARNIEVTKEFCDKYCSEDKEICKIEDGIEVDTVLTEIVRTLNPES